MTEDRLVVTDEAYDEFQRSLASIIYGRRRVLGLSREQVARSCGTSVRTLERYELGEREMKVSVLMLMGRTLGTTGGKMVDAADVFAAPSSGGEQPR